MDHIHNSIIATDAFWALIALIIFSAILFALRIPTKIKDLLDRRASNIEKELSEARRYKQEAQLLLIETQKKLKEAENEAQMIIESAHREARQLANDMRKANEEYLEQQKIAIERKIEFAYSEFIREVKSSAIDGSLDKAMKIINEKLDDESLNRIFDVNIENLKDVAL